MIEPIIKDRKYNHEMNDTICLCVEINIAIYLVATIYSIVRIAIVHSKSNLVNKHSVLRTYYSVFLVLFFRVLTGVFYLLWQHYELSKVEDESGAMELKYSGIFSVLHKLFNILPLPCLLLLVSFTAYEWLKLLYKIEF